MPRKCKDCPICGKRALKRLANHLADVHELSSQERQPYLIRAKPTALDLENVLTELYRLIGDSKKQSKWNRSGISLSQRDPINVGRARPTDFADSYLRFGACYVDENTTIRFSETISPNSYR